MVFAPPGPRPTDAGLYPRPQPALAPPPCVAGWDRDPDSGTLEEKWPSLSSSPPSLRSLRPRDQDEDEWKEFEQKEVDYSGLRVQAMQISEKEEEDNEKREDPGDNWEEGGGGGGGVEKSSGPWNKTAPVQAPPAAVIVTETPEPAMTSGVYRPPGARLTTTRKTPQGPPEIYSDTQFPSLQSTAKHVESRKDKEMEKSFEVVRHKTRGRDEVSKNQALKLQLDNQYAVLENQKSSHTQYN
ncbi:protein CDV3 homolog [Puma concolor]|uniref:Protein CDV3 homolog n=1 Tax=Puma concolor TaxID=9696 RepID=A0A6P6H155_PUMCO|nr:protein CDV3 homolog [Puma concolor]